jgi:AMMECR1 domain-containing protein
MHGYRGLLLPQVPIEHHWDRETFLDQTCRKAGLPPDAWRKGAIIEGFTAEVFGEKSPDQVSPKA